MTQQDALTVTVVANSCRTNAVPQNHMLVPPKRVIMFSNIAFSTYAVDAAVLCIIIDLLID